MQKTAFGSGLLLACPTDKPERYRGLIKTLLVMKLTVFFIVLAFFQVRANTSLAQTVTISGKDLTMKQIFSAIEKQTDHVLLITKGTIDKAKPVSLTVHKMPLREFLDLILKDEQLDYEIQGKTILLSRKSSLPTNPDVILPGMPALFPDVNLVKGTVFNEENIPLSGVSIVVKKTKKGTVTDAAGNFSLQAEKNETLVVSYVGYVNQEVKAGESHLIIKLRVAHSVLDQTQVIAYGKTSKRLSTGNISTVTAEEIERQPVMTALEALIGKVPGLEIRQTSGNSAAPISVLIRGKNGISPNAFSDPLYVIDGMPMSNLNSSQQAQLSASNLGSEHAGYTNLGGLNPLLGLNPNDIESISVLKDANATAMYGSRAANGVILITTKKGKKGPTQFSININNSATFNEKYPKLMNTQEYLSVRREALLNDGLLLNNENARDLILWDTTKYTDWQRTMVGVGSTTQATASLSGGMGQSTYRLSGGFRTQKPLMNNGGKNQTGTFNGSFSHASANQKFSLQLLSSLGFTDVTAYSVSNNLGKLPPNAPDIYDANGNFNFIQYRRENMADFPFAGLKRPSNSKTFDVSNQFSARYEILKGLTLSANAGQRFSYNDNSNIRPKASFDPIILAIVDPSMGIYGKSVSKNFQVETQLQYLTYIGKGELSVQLIGNYQKAVSSGETFTAEAFANDKMMKSHNNASKVTVREGYLEYKYLSAITRISYNWDNKYIIDLNGRRDGSSRFGPGKQFGNFGSVGLAWIASDENWIKKYLPTWLSLIKFRASTGIVGSDNVGAYEYLTRWSKAINTSASQALYSYNGIPALHAIKPLNQDYQWETTQQQEFSTTIGFLKNRINVDFSFYRKYSDNQLLDFPIPNQTGFGSVLMNNPAAIENKGLEISASASLLNSENWAISFSIFTSRNWNKLVKFRGIENSPTYKNTLRVGQSINTGYYLHYTGIDPLTGSYTFEDYNKDGKITVGSFSIPLDNTDDRYVVINTDNRYNIGSGLNIRYKSLSVSTSFEFRKQLRTNPFLNQVPGEMENTVLRDEVKNNHWKKPGDQTKYPRYTSDPSTLGIIGPHDAVFIDGSYLRMMNLAVSWNLPKSWIDRVKIKGASIALQTQNLFTVSNYPGIDPSLINSNSEFGSPVPRTIATSLSLNF